MSSRSSSAPGALLQLAAAHPQRYPVLLDSAAEGALSQMLAAGGAAARRPVAGCARRRASIRRAAAARRRRVSSTRSTRTGALQPAGAATATGRVAFRRRLVRVPGLRAGAGDRTHAAPLWPAASCTDPRPVAVALRVPAALLRDATWAGLSGERGIGRCRRARGASWPMSRAAAARRGPAGDAAQVELQEEAPEAYSAAHRARAGAHPRRRHLPGEPVARTGGRSCRADCRRQRCTSACAGPIPRLSRPSRSSAISAILSSSPERLLRIRGRRLDTRPIAGTHPRGAIGHRGSRAGRGTGRTSQGARRARHADRPGAQ